MHRNIPYAPTPEAFGAFPGDMDNCEALQAWLNFGGELRLDRVYRTSRPLFYQGKTFVKGIHPALTRIEAIDFSPNLLNAELLRNRTPKAQHEITVDNFIRFENISIGGSQMNAIERGQFCFAAIGVRGLELENFHVSDWHRGGIGLNNVVNASLRGAKIQRYGSYTEAPDVTPENPCGSYDGGVGLWINHNCYAITVESMYILEGEWSGAEISGRNLTLRNWRIEDVREAGIFSGPTNSLMDDIKINGVCKKVCSGHGFETGGYKNKIVNCTIRNTALNGILLTTPNQFVVANNVLENCNYLVDTPTDVAGGITIRPSGDVYTCRDLVVQGNVILPDKNFAIACLSQPGHKYNNCDFRGNVYGSDGDWLGGKAVRFLAEDMGECCYV